MLTPAALSPGVPWKVGSGRAWSILEINHQKVMLGEHRLHAQRVPVPHSEGCCRCQSCQGLPCSLSALGLPCWELSSQGCFSKKGPIPKLQMGKLRHGMSPGEWGGYEWAAAQGSQPCWPECLLGSDPDDGTALNVPVEAPAPAPIPVPIPVPASARVKAAAVRWSLQRPLSSRGGGR